MTAGNNGSGTPENDDPFAYLYRSEGGTDGGAGGAATQQPGVPRTSYNQVRAVGQRRYGGAQQPQQAPQHQATAAHQQSNAYYAAPETVPGGRAAARREAAAGGPGGSGGRGRGGRNHKGLLIGAIAVVAAVVLGVGAAIAFSDGDETGDNQAGSTPTPTAEATGEEEKGTDEGSDGSAEAPAPLPEEDAASLRLEGDAIATSGGDVKGSRAKSGAYVAGLDKPGAGVSWSFEVPEDGKYTLFVGYSVPGKDADSTLTINGEVRQDPLNMKNFAKAGEGDWEKGWTRTFAWVDLNKGANTVKISCEQGDQCGFVLDQVWLEKGHVKN